VAGLLAGRKRDPNRAGNFAPGEELLWDHMIGPDITLTFATPVDAAGAAIQADYYGAFTAQIRAVFFFAAMGAFTLATPRTP
jgi:hypothetical protein